MLIIPGKEKPMRCQLENSVYDPFANTINNRMKRLGTLWSLKVDQMMHAEVVTFLQEHGEQIDNQIYFYKMS